MKWRAEVLPAQGERRTRPVFAWTPTQIGECVYWLERVTVHERWEYIEHILCDNGWVVEGYSK
jgi:hypothetical protein